MAASEALLADGTLTFSVETRVLRELGERLVKQPDVALVELVKNAYDADAELCSVEYESDRIVVEDNGTGMTLTRFTNAWMRIGTGSKEGTPLSERYGRAITGEKGIGRFAVRFLGRALHLETVADDESRDMRTRLTADFDWPRFDRNEDLGAVRVPYQLVEAKAGTDTGTRLVITKLRPPTHGLDLDAVRTGSIGILTPLRSLFRQTVGKDNRAAAEDPGFGLNVRSEATGESMDVAGRILEAYVLRARLSVGDEKLDLKVYRRGKRRPELQIADTYVNEVGGVEADIRFFPRRRGTFAGLPVDGRYAQSWIRDNHGVAVFDRMFRVPPYGAPDNDWLRLQADAASNRRDPRSSLAKRHLAMAEAVRTNTGLNWMLRLPQSVQLVGLVCVNGRRVAETEEQGEGLIASADREGFLANEAFRQLTDLVRGSVEALAYVDRELQQKEEAKERAEQLAAVREETQTAIREIEDKADIAEEDKRRIVSALLRSQRLAEEQGEEYREREQRLEVMSLLGVVAGFMTHEFGVALAELEGAHDSLQELAGRGKRFKKMADDLGEHIEQLKEYVGYTSLYIESARGVPSAAYPARPRISRVKRIYGPYAKERGIRVELEDVDRAVDAPLVPVALYDGLALNLFTNALKAVTAKVGDERARIAFRVWNEGRWHNLEVSDTGIGIPAALKDRVFDPLFTTTASRNDPLGSGMGLGLTLVRRSAEAFGGRAAVVRPREGFATTVRIQLPVRVGRGT